MPITTPQPKSAPACCTDVAVAARAAVALRRCSPCCELGAGPCRAPIGRAAAPKTHRQCPKGPARIDWKRGNAAGEIKSATDAAISGLLDAGTRGLLRDMAVAFPGQTLPSLTELQSTPLLSLSSKKRILKRDLSTTSDCGDDAEASMSEPAGGDEDHITFAFAQNEIIPLAPSTRQHYSIPKHSL